ncbi:ethanolamine ammonia-lyase [Desulfonema ishimotonii]|uniref:Ethanolamine ammonia-lyase n=1 Tax=Desulfonema ishimotonii TaxID=45657 RepID=A0A401FSD9_9BACT|nr:ethanolamine ammonia-lyase subunit EutB [Desulfonema ishimotonii]GBC59891.1 ethanolamine ammonia-lyase [Desulfonema ishimotonii]
MREKSKILTGACACILCLASVVGAVTIESVKPDEDVFGYVQRVKGAFDHSLYQQVIGAANAFKEGDEGLGVAADNDISRVNARMLLANTKIKAIHEHPLFEDNLQKLIWKTTDAAQYEKVRDWTMGDLKHFLLTQPEAEIRGIMGGLNSDVIGSVIKLMSNAELTVIGKKVFNPLPGSNLGAAGYLGARIQPNSPTDNPEDIMWQVFNGWSYATGDLILGNNPVSDSVENIAAIEKTLRDVLVTFGMEKTLPWCVLSHIDKQAEVEKKYPGETAIWFQSLAGTDDANQTFDLTIEKMMNYAKMRNGQYGLYFETGQGADYTNGAGHGFDMVVHESRKYGFARALAQEVAKVAPEGKPWLHLNDVAGFIGPEVFKSREQLVRCCLEDIVMGKLHGLCLGLDICSTLHMPVSLDDLDWCMDQIAPASPSYLMALPTKNDPMLSYLTTGFQDHVRLREKFGYKVNDDVWAFFKKIKIVDENDKYTEHFGDPIWVYYQYKLAKGDTRTKDEIYAEGEAAIQRIEARGVPIARGMGKNPGDLNPELREKIWALYNDAKVSLWAEFTPEFINTIPNAVVVSTNSGDREDYVAHPPTGEKLSPSAVATLETLRDAWAGKAPDVQIIISDGLNAKAIMDENHLTPYLEAVKKELAAAGYTVGEKNVVVTSGRVRAGYEIGSVLFGKSDAARPKIVLHIIGERPGSGHHNYSVYIAAPKAEIWGKNGVDHDIVRVISGISDTAYKPTDAARETVTIVKEMTDA